MERPKALEGRPFLTDAEVAEIKKRSNNAGLGDEVFLEALAKVEERQNPAGGATVVSQWLIDREFDNRTSLIVDPPDGKIPPRTEEGSRRWAAWIARVRRPLAGPEDTSTASRCITFGVPRLGGTFAAGIYGYYQILQTPAYVVFFMEAIHEARIIPLDGRPHLPGRIRQWSGDPRGHWEAKTLVVDTTNFSPQSFFKGSAENLHLVERFTRIAPHTLKYDITVDDPTTWTKPWTASVRLHQTQEAIYEFACHEGNYDVMAGMLGAARADQKATEEAVKRGSK